MQFRSVSFVALFVLAVSFAALSAQAETINIPMKVCNHTSRDLHIATSYLPVGYTSSRWWTNEGWFRINAGECGIVGHSGNMTFYLRGESVDNTRYWANGTNRACVVYPGPYTILESGLENHACPAGAKSVDFSELEATVNDTFTWDLY